MRSLKTIILACSMAILPGLSAAGEFQVSPIMLDLGKTKKSGTITVSNVGTDKINLQIQATEWKQDTEGKDLYSETNDIIYFPKIVSVDKGDSQLIRVGIKEGLIAHEKAYRLYIQEIPDPGKTSSDKAKFQIAVMIRFGVPIFIKPADENLKGMVEPVTVERGIATAVVKNAGNDHFRITKVVVRGELCVDHGGMITGEHGVGLEKLKAMCLQFREGEIAAVHDVKRAFDPAGILNPGKAVPTLKRCAEWGGLHVRGGRIPHPDIPRF